MNLNVISYKTINIINWLVFIVTLLFEMGLIGAINDTRPDDERNFLIFIFIIALLPTLFLFWLRSRIASNFHVQKHMSEKRFEKQVDKIKEKSRKDMQFESTRSDYNNLSPLVDSLKSEMVKRKNHITPFNYQRLENMLNIYLQSNDVNNVSKLYDLVIKTEYHLLDQQLNKFFTTQ